MWTERVGIDASTDARGRAGAFLLIAGAAAMAMALLPATAHAQLRNRDYLFGTPRANFTLRTGVDAAAANSDLFSFTDSVLTLRKRDYAGAMIAGDFGFRLNSNVDATFSLGYARSVAPSEFRDWLDNNNLPIQQQTEFTRVPLMVNLRMYLEPQGRAIGHYAWVPTRFAPYIGGGVGSTWYRFRQSGDFIDFNTNDIYSDIYMSSGWAPTASLFAGSDFSITPGIAFNLEGRYSWAQANLGQDFSGFKPIDLSGLAVTVGLKFLY